MTHSTFPRWGGFSLVRLLPLAIALCIATACAKHENAEMGWVRAALQRNPNVEIVATDEEAGVFTLRDKRSGNVTIVALRDLAVAPTSQLIQAVLEAPPIDAAQPAPAPEATPESIPKPTAPRAAQPATNQLAQESPSSPRPAANAKPAKQARYYTIERSGGQVKVSGPGVSIVSAGAGAQPAKAQPNTEPIICEGNRMLHFDSRDILAEGDAIIARGGCELFVTNSRIVASGTGIVVQDAAVHIDNSQVDGAIASFNAQSGARVFVRGSTFQGVPRLDKHASVQDQGGNQWR